HALRCVGKVVAAQVDGDGSITVVGQRAHLLAPRIPEVGKAMDHHDQRTLTQCRIVDLHATGVRILVLDSIPYVPVVLGHDESLNTGWPADYITTSRSGL